VRIGQSIDVKSRRVPKKANLLPGRITTIDPKVDPGKPENVAVARHASEQGPQSCCPACMRTALISTGQLQRYITLPQTRDYL